MNHVALQGNILNLSGDFPLVGMLAPHFMLTKGDLTIFDSNSVMGTPLVLNIFPSLDTAVCATGVRKFNEMATAHPDNLILAISCDLPFAQVRFCALEGIKNVMPLSAFRFPHFGISYGVDIVDGILAGLLARAVFVIDRNFKIVYAELVPDITQEPNYSAALVALEAIY